MLEYTWTRACSVDPGLRVMIVGMTGTGKSSLANSLLGSPQFPLGRGLKSETRFCDWRHAQRGPFTLEVRNGNSKRANKPKAV